MLSIVRQDYLHPMVTCDDNRSGDRN